MEFKDIVKNRYSCRQYQDKKVPEETIRELLEIIVYSASAINLQPWRIKVVSDRETKDKLFPVAFNQEHVRSCSHLLVLCADTDYSAIIAKFDKTLVDAAAPDEVRGMLVGMATNISSGMNPEQQLTWSQNQVLHRPGQRHQRGLLAGPGFLPHDRLPARRVRSDPGPSREHRAHRAGGRGLPGRHLHGQDALPGGGDPHLTGLASPGAGRPGRPRPPSGAVITLPEES